MSNLTIWDHAFAAFVAIAYPTYSALTIRKSLAEIAAGGEAALVGAYRNVIGTWLAAGLIVLGLWYYTNRNWRDLGLVPDIDERTVIAFAVAAVVTLLFVLPLRRIALETKSAAKMERMMGDLVVFLPRSAREKRWFYGVSVNAGVNEELIFRGYLLWYLQHFMPLAWAAVVAVLAFGFAHAYQGLKQLPGILLVSAVCVGLYVYTGSLLVPVVFHALLDGLQGHYIAAARRTDDVVA